MTTTRGGPRGRGAASARRPLRCVARSGGAHLGAHLGRRLADALGEGGGHHAEDAAAHRRLLGEEVRQRGVLDDVGLDRRLRRDRHVRRVAEEERHLANEVALAALGELLALLGEDGRALADVDRAVGRLALGDDHRARVVRHRRADLGEEALAEGLDVRLRLADALLLAAARTPCLMLTLSSCLELAQPESERCLSDGLRRRAKQQQRRRDRVAQPRGGSDDDDGDDGAGDNGGNGDDSDGGGGGGDDDICGGGNGGGSGGGNGTTGATKTHAHTHTQMTALASEHGKPCVGREGGENKEAGRPPMGGRRSSGGLVAST